MQRPHKPMGAQTDTPAERRLRSLLRAGGDLADGKDPMEIGEYAFDPAAEKFAELFRDGKARAIEMQERVIRMREKIRQRQALLRLSRLHETSNRSAMH